MKDIFVRTKNVENFQAMMKGLESRSHEGVLGMVYGRAGRGKTRTARQYAAQNDGGAYVYAKTEWTPLWMLQDICKKVGVAHPPSRSQWCFEAIGEALHEYPVTIYLDEVDKIHPRLLETIRELCDVTSTPIVLLGEESLLPRVTRVGRLHSRTYAPVEFGAITPEDVYGYAAQAASFKLTAETSREIQAAAGGDFRMVIRCLEALEGLCAANDVEKPDLALVKQAAAMTVGRRK